jgi:hypothetical protein
MLTTLLPVVALSVLAMTVAAVLRSNLSGGSSDLGCVSEHWLTEYRADEASPPR